MPSVASSLARGMGYASPYVLDTGPTAHPPPVYTILLSGLFRLFGYTPLAGFVALGINVCLSALAIIPVYLLARRLFDSRCAMFAAALWALFPLTGYTDALYVWNTSLFTFALTCHLAATLYLDGKSTHRAWAAYGALTGLLLLIDPAALTEVAACAVWLLTQHITGGHRLERPFSRFALALALAVTIAGTWTVRNYIVFGHIVPFRSNAGLELDVGVRDFELAGAPPRSLPNRNPEEMQRYRELGELRYMHERGSAAREWIALHPGEYAVRFAKRIVSYWTALHLTSDIFFFYGRYDRLKVLLFSLPAIGAFLSLIRMIDARHRAAWLCAGVLMLYPAVYYATHTLPRYRLPIEPLLLCLAAGLLDRSWGMRRRRALPGQVPAAVKT